MKIINFKNDAWDLSRGDKIIFLDKEGHIRTGTVKIKTGRAGRHILGRTEPSRYAYAQYRYGEKIKEVYLGVAG